MAAAECKAADCAVQRLAGETREDFVRRKAAHPEFVSAIGKKYREGGRLGKKIANGWFTALDPKHPMTDQSMDFIEDTIKSFWADING